MPDLDVGRGEHLDAISGGGGEVFNRDIGAGGQDDLFSVAWDGLLSLIVPEDNGVVQDGVIVNPHLVPLQRIRKKDALGGEKLVSCNREIAHVVDGNPGPIRQDIMVQYRVDASVDRDAHAFKGIIGDGREGGVAFKVDIVIDQRVALIEVMRAVAPLDDPISIVHEQVVGNGVSRRPLDIDAIEVISKDDIVSDDIVGGAPIEHDCGRGISPATSTDGKPADRDVVCGADDPAFLTGLSLIDDRRMFILAE